MSSLFFSPKTILSKKIKNTAKIAATALLMLTVNGAQAASTTPFITTWEVTDSDPTITIPVGSGNYAYHVLWGDGKISWNVQGEVSHTYDSSGMKELQIFGDFPAMYFGNSQIRTVEAWGDQNWQTMGGAFFRASNLTINALDAPNLSEVTDMGHMFREVGTLSGNFANWDTSNVTSMFRMFEKSKDFNEDITQWDVSNVVTMSAMFRSAHAFNQDIGHWTTSSLVISTWMFREAYAFDHALGGWDISNLTRAHQMLSHKGYSTANYDETLRGWATQDVQSNVPFYVNTTYCTAGDERNALINDHGWIITDFGLKCD